MQHDIPAPRSSQAHTPSVALWQHLGQLSALDWSYGLVLTLAIVLLTVNLTTYPVPWFDEGYFLSVAKTLAQDGLYALPDSAGPRMMDSSIGSGPTLIVPIALMFEVAGVGMLQARLVAVAMGVFALGVYIVLARRLVGPSAALGATVLLLAGTPEPYTGFVMLSRQALGEVLALGWFICGIWFWLRAHDNRRSRWRWLIFSGLAFGFAIVTKSQSQVVLPIVLAAICLADRLYYRQSSWMAFIVPGVVAASYAAAWYGVQLIVLGMAGFVENMNMLRIGAATISPGFDLSLVQNAIGALWRSGFLLWGMPGLLYGAWLSRSRDRSGLAHAWVLALVVIWLIWFVFFSIGWARYGFVALALLPIWSVSLIYATIRSNGKWVRGVVAVAVVALLTYNSYPLLIGIFGPQDNSAATFSAYLNEHIPSDAVVESWEWNLDVTAPQRFHHPPSLVLYQAIDVMQRGKQLPPDAYDPAVGQAEYLIDGPFSSWTGIYRTYIEQYGDHLVSHGPYTLYRIDR
ncbi:MAG: hypothetical protein GFH27_549283n53 [Chloroflexi bacterium AL-W]|nr:hypothetical protein [Chloroflexi bacterium AL-N1]NOK64827.1 hypothetical protein [Chloroflexi bacterium AL-N10]NOK76597.1 hypothetical protein [Chloroflexi bacterium AL-N5]NOK80174.1 hypothetical protein [Chloroflexi bacterium AL-W]NOK86687.1 hypothetical protein [Chloroflexi bacterium AL-N15]